MKRDLDLIREIMLKIGDSGAELHVEDFMTLTKPERLPQNATDEERTEYAINLEDYEYERESVAYQIGLLHDKGYIEAITCHTLKESVYIISGLTIDGDEFLNTIRDNEVWDDVKNRVSKAGAFSLDLIKAVAIQVLKTKILEILP